MKNLPHEIVFQIISYLKHINDFLNLRLVNSHLRNDALCYWHGLDAKIVTPRATMIDTMRCMICGAYNSGLHTKLNEAQILLDTYPRRVFIHCKSIKCYHSTVQSMKQAICTVNECRIVQNWKTFLPKQIWIRRSSGAMQLAEPLPFYLYLLHNKTWIRADFFDSNSRSNCSKLVAYEECKIEEPKLIVF